MDRFVPSDLPEINSWYSARGLPEITSQEIPITGYIHHGIAAGFLIRTDTCVCYLEGFITNPEASRTDRSKALDDIVAMLLTRDETTGYRVVTVITKHDTIRRRAKKLGFFTVGDYTLLTRKLT